MKAGDASAEGERSISLRTALDVGRRVRERRQQLGISQGELARKVDRTQTAVSYWEAGKRMPGLEDLLDVAAVLKVDVSALMPDPASRQPVAASLRALADSLDASSLADALETFAKKMSLRPAPPRRISVTAAGSRDAAEQLLFSAKVSTSPVDVEGLAKACGVRVADFDFGGEVDGLVVQLNDGAAIGLDSRGRKKPKRRRFTLAHELGHHLLRHSSTFNVDFAEAGRTLGDSPTYNWRHEKAANEFAANLLMPATMVHAAVGKTTRVAELASMFEVSEQAMGFRLNSLGLRG